MIFLLSIAFAADPNAALRDAVAARLKVPSTDVSVEKIGISGAPEDAEWQVQLPNGRCWGGFTVRLDATTPDGKVRHYTAYTTVSAFKEVPVVDRDTPVGSEVSFHLERQQLDLLSGEPVSADGKWRAKVNLHEGEAMVSGRVEPMPDAIKGTPVKITVSSGALRIEAPGQLNGDAWVGRPVEVMNLATHTLLTGIYEAEGKVSIGGSP
jgi:flagella basal body P-ring formation protein FlgA